MAEFAELKAGESRSFYVQAPLLDEQEKDLVRLADYLGHSSIETTRRYTMLTSEEVCKKSLELDLFSEKNRGRIRTT